MATRKKSRGRRRASARRNPVNPVNPARRRRRRRSSVFARRRNPVNPTRHRRRIGRRRRRNPVGGGLLWQGIRLATAGLAVGIAQPFVRNFVGPYVGASPLANAGITFGTAWGLSFLARMIPFTRRYENDILLAGATISAAQLISTYVTPYLRLGGAANPSMSGWGNRRGLAGIGVTTGVPPTIVPPPLPAPNAAAANGMSGLGARPGNYAW